LLYGVEYWRLLGLGLAEHKERLAVWIGEMLYMINFAFTAAFFGVPDTAAWALQWFLALASSVAVVVVWRSNRVGFDLKAAALLCAIILSAPYLWYYETVFLVPLALFLLRGGALSLKPLHFLILVPLWLGAVLQSFNMVLDLFDPRWLPVAYIPPLVLFCLGLCLRQALSGPALIARAA
jgi:arabinofuranan 3-O-arabinosyltransferase